VGDLVNSTALSNTVYYGSESPWPRQAQDEQFFYPTSTVVGGVPAHTANDGACDFQPLNLPHGGPKRLKYMAIHTTLAQHAHIYSGTGNVVVDVIRGNLEINVT